MLDRKLFIRADADAQIGAGHVMRCLALAQVWKDRGGDVTFITRCESAVIKGTLREEGFAFIQLPKQCTDAEDLKTTLSTLKNESIREKNWLVLDGYHFTPEYQKSIRNSGNRLLVLDDTNHLPQYHADILLNPNIQAASLGYNIDGDALCSLGLRYIPLRREFSSRNRRPKETPAVAQKVLITLGGSDPDNVALKMIKAFKLMDRPDLRARVILGPVNPHVMELTQEIRDDARIQLIKSPPDMAEQMAWADLAVSAAGTTCWEQACMGVPTMVVILADNQRENAVGLQQLGAAINMGWHQDMKVKEIVVAVSGLIGDVAVRRRLSLSARELVDALGAERVMQSMLNLGKNTAGDCFVIRPATLADAFFIWKLANDPVCRENAFSPDPIPISEHVTWYRKKLASPDTRSWILELNGRISAQIRYDKTDEQTAEIDFSVVADHRGRGLGSRALGLTSKRACSELNVNRLIGIVLDSNHASASAFEKAGYKKSSKRLRKAGRCCLQYEYSYNGHYPW